jgi:ATP-dependent Lon protease
LTELGVAHQIYACCGVSDSSAAGTARQWTTGTPSLAVSLAARYKTAAPGIVLDEISRTGSGRHNGSLTDALLAMVEPVSARRHLDPYLCSETDLSAVIWLATCNDLEGVPAPLRDRFRIIGFPSPTLEHMPALANAILRQAVEDVGLSAAWATGLDGVELEALAATWTNGSLRGLRKLVEGVLAARDHGAVLS